MVHGSKRSEPAKLCATMPASVRLVLMAVSTSRSAAPYRRFQNTAPAPSSSTRSPISDSAAPHQTGAKGGSVGRQRGEALVQPPVCGAAEWADAGGDLVEQVHQGDRP